MVRAAEEYGSWPVAKAPPKTAEFPIPNFIDDPRLPPALRAPQFVNDISSVGPDAWGHRRSGIVEGTREWIDDSTPGGYWWDDSTQEIWVNGQSYPNDGTGDAIDYIGDYNAEPVSPLPDFSRPSPAGAMFAPDYPLDTSQIDDLRRVRHPEPPVPTPLPPARRTNAWGGSLR